jgi:hypothetical protein
MTLESTAPGAYGLVFPDLSEAAHLLTPSPGWPPWAIRHRTPREDDGLRHDADVLSSHRAQLRLAGGSGWAELNRERRETVMVLADRPRPAEMVHPFLSLTAATTARWRGWLAFHAGCFIHQGAAIGVLGPKGTGKSSLLAWMALHEGVDVVADDVLVVNGDEQALAGPRCLDLRRGTAEFFAAGEELGVVGARERWRVQLGPIPAAVPLGGWLELGWAERTSVERLTPTETFKALARNMALRVLPPSSDHLLALCGRPGWRLLRPRRFEAMPEAARLLGDYLARRPGDRAAQPDRL